MRKNEFDAFKEVATKRGTVVEFEGVTYYCEGAFSDSDCYVAYAYADGKYDEDEMTTFKVIWDLKGEWVEAIEAYDTSNPDDYSPLLDDESNACDWDSPREVIEL